MNSTFCEDTDKLLFFCLDAILVFKNLREDHIRHLSVMLDKLERNDLFVEKNKFEMLTTKK